MNRWIYIDWSLSYHKILNLKTSMKLQLDTTSSGCRGLSTHLILQTIFFLCQCTFTSTGEKLNWELSNVFSLCTQCGSPAFPHSLHRNLTEEVPSSFHCLHVTPALLFALWDILAFVFHFFAIYTGYIYRHIIGRNIQNVDQETGAWKLVHFLHEKNINKL